MKEQCFAVSAPKNKYYTKQEAEQAKKYIESTRDVQLNIYYCMYCGTYHLTSDTGNS